MDAVSIADRTVTLDDGRVLRWSDLIFATGARARIPDLPGIGLEGVVTLRRMEDARRIATLMPDVQDVVIVGEASSVLKWHIALSRLARRRF